MAFVLPNFRFNLIFPFLFSLISHDGFNLITCNTLESLSTISLFLEVSSCFFVCASTCVTLILTCLAISSNSIQASLDQISLPFIFHPASFHFPDQIAIPLATHQGSVNIYRYFCFSFRDCLAANSAAMTSACWADFLCLGRI